MAVGTFVEKYYDTATAKDIIYGAKWFEFLMLLLIVNFINNIFKYKLLRKDRFSVLLFHIAFIIIFIGAGITRYVSFEGSMRIREGSIGSDIISSNTFLKLQASNDEKVLEYETPMDLSAVYKSGFTWPFAKTFSKKYKFNDEIISLQSVDYIPHARDTIVLDTLGQPIITFVVPGESGRVTSYMKSGDIKQIGNTLFSFNNELPGTVQFFSDGTKILFFSPFDGEYMTMATQKTGKVYQDSLQELIPRSLYTLNDTRFVVPNLPVSGDIDFIETDEKQFADVVKFVITSGAETKEVFVKGGKGRTNFDKNVKINNLNLVLGYGSKVYKTPFAIELRDFELERYPGSNSASSYASEITIIDDGKETEHRIFMNNVLDHKGYRLFQSSYDSDEGGTILSVNHDLVGTLVTYVGYIMLFLGMFLTLFWKGTRFSLLNNTLKKLSKNKNALIIPLLFSFLLANAQHSNTSTPFSVDSLQSKFKIDKAHSDKFGELLVQDYSGRIKPINTLALEIIRKIYGKDKIYGFDANQFFIALHADPVSWLQAPMIKVSSKGGDKLKKLVKVDENGYTSLMNMIDSKDKKGYILSSYQQEAFAKDPSTRDEFDKEIIKLDERFQILNGIPTGQYMRIIPIKNDLNNTWTSWMTQDQKIDSTARSYFEKYFTAVGVGLKKQNWAKADYAVASISRYQQKWGEKVIPSKISTTLELLYNKSNVFFRIMLAYTLLAGVLLVFSFLSLFSEAKWVKYTTTFFLSLVFFTYIIHGIGLGIRWYISGHAPWSTGYEAVIFISWIGVLSGLLLYRNRNAFIPTTGCLVAVIMMGFAHGGTLLDPQITPLVPVLKSYWLLIHVAIITSSYGFFGLGFVLSIITLVLIILKKYIKVKAIEHSIKELSIVNELSVTIGIFALTIGTFLGGMWANESWGRYWSWDPKETWAFISVIVYAFVLHMRLIPGLKGSLAFSIGSMWAYSSIVFTYIGVNYFLSGLHSYAAGDPVVIPSWVYVTTFMLFVLSVLAWWSNKKVKSVN